MKSLIYNEKNNKKEEQAFKPKFKKNPNCYKKI